MEIQFDLEKIFSKEKMEERQEEIYEQIGVMVENAGCDPGQHNTLTPKEEVLVGALTSLVLQQLNLVQYVDMIASAINQVWIKTNIPVQICDFSTWYDIQGLTPEETKAYMENKHREFMASREEGRSRIIKLEH